MRCIEESRVMVLPFVTKTNQWGNKYNEIVPVTDDMIKFMHSSLMDLVDTHQKLLQNSDFKDMLKPTTLVGMAIEAFTDLVRQDHKGMGIEWIAFGDVLQYEMRCTISVDRFSNHLKFNIKTEKLNVTKSRDTKGEGA